MYTNGQASIPRVERAVSRPFTLVTPGNWYLPSSATMSSVAAFASAAPALW